MFVIDTSVNRYQFVPDNMFDPKKHKKVEDPATVSQLQQKYNQVAPQQPQGQGDVLRSALQQKFTNETNELSRSRIAEAWQKATGTPLFQESGQGLEAVKEVMSKGGAKLINKGKTKDERIAIAEEILASGGVEQYRKMLPIQDLADDKELKELNSVTDLLTQIDMALPSYKKENMAGGTGPIAGRISPLLDIIGTSEGREARSTAEQIRAAYQQAISGKVVSEQESQRLKAFLPSKDKTETKNREDAERLKFRLQLNIELFERAKREGLTTSEAYNKYGKDMVDKRFEEQFGKGKGGSDTTGGQSTGMGQGPRDQYSSAALGPLGALAFGPPELKAAAVAGPAVGAGIIGAGAVGSALAPFINPQIIGKARDVAQKSAKNIPVKTITTIKETLKESAKLDPEESKIIQGMLKGLDYAKGNVDKLERLAEKWNKAYTNRGDVRPGKEAFNEGAVILKELIKEKAPEVAKQTQRFRNLKQIPRAAQQGLTTAIKASALGRLLGF